jgi:hypothetical protein
MELLRPFVSVKSNLKNIFADAHGERALQELMRTLTIRISSKYASSAYTPVFPFF